MMGNVYGISVAAGLSAAVLLFAYTPILSRFSLGLVSPYAKADVTRRLFAATLDGSLVGGAFLLYWISGVALYGLPGAAYLLFRDGIRGQSIGKFFMGLVVISLETGRPSTLTSSLRRNFLLLIPGANVVAVFLEARTLVTDPQGQRLGDRLAQTQVVEGFGARDLVKSFQEWLMGLGADFGRAAGRRERAPVRTDRAA